MTNSKKCEVIELTRFGINSDDIAAILRLDVNDVERVKLEHWNGVFYVPLSIQTVH